MTDQRIRSDHPVTNLHGYVIRDSSNIRFIGWYSKEKFIIVWFKGGGLYRYENVSYQRAMAAVRAPSVGSYVNRKIVGKYATTKLA